MHCPFCAAEETKVIDSRLINDGTAIKRRRECAGCSERFSTHERAELELPRVVKRDGQRCSFQVDKLRAGMMRALDKRPVKIEDLDSAVAHILHKVRTAGEREVNSQWIGELVMDQLRVLDQVAYVRFASIYRSFQDVDAFSEEVEKLKQKLHESEINND